jgi:hypothetical protein
VTAVDVDDMEDVAAMNGTSDDAEDVVKGDDNRSDDE